MTTATPTSVAPNFAFVLIDLTTDKTPSELKPASAMQSMIDAWQEQTIQYGQHYGMPSVAFRIGSGPDDRTPTEIAIHFRDTIDEAPGALAYHQVVNGVPDIELGVDLFSSLTSGGESVCAGGSHELLETYRDAGANEWSEKQDGSNLMGASEVCDPVQNTSYNASNGNGLSNFVLPSYFVPQSLGLWDYLGVMQAQNDFQTVTRSRLALRRRLRKLAESVVSHSTTAKRCLSLVLSSARNRRDVSRIRTRARIVAASDCNSKCLPKNPRRSLR